MDYDNTIKGGLIGGLIGVLLGFIFRRIHIILMLVGVYAIYSNMTNDPKREAAKTFELGKVEVEKSLVTMSPAQIDLETFTVSTIIENRSQARAYDFWLQCRYLRKLTDEDKPLWFSTPVVGGYVMPGTTKQLVFRSTAERDTILSTVKCSPHFKFEDSDLIKANVVQGWPKDEIMAQIDTTIQSITTGKRRLDYHPIYVTGEITNNSRFVVSEVRLACDGLLDPFGNRDRIYTKASVVVMPGETKQFELRAGEIQTGNEPPTDLFCRVIDYTTAKG